MPNYLISIIIPFYNTKSYFFKECLNSIVRQTYQNFECILVDDGTTNIETIKIAQKITVKDKFKLVRLHKNVGLGPARNAGIKHANGDIFVYVDSDDYIKSDILERINKIFNKWQNLDMYCFGVKTLTRLERIIDTSSSPIRTLKPTNVNITLKVIRLGVSAWGKAYSRKFYLSNNIKFLDYNIYHEDAYHFIICIAYAKQIFIDREWGYVVRDTPNSITKSPYSSWKPLGVIRATIEGYNVIKNQENELVKHFSVFLNSFTHSRLKLLASQNPEMKTDSKAIEAYKELLQFEQSIRK